MSLLDQFNKLMKDGQLSTIELMKKDRRTVLLKAVEVASRVYLTDEQKLTLAIKHKADINAIESAQKMLDGRSVSNLFKV